MAEILGLGCSRAPMILNPPEEWGNMRKSIYSRIPNYQAPPSMVEELADANGLTPKFGCSAFDEEFDRKNLELLKKGERSKLAALTPRKFNSRVTTNS